MIAAPDAEVVRPIAVVIVVLAPACALEATPGDGVDATAAGDDASVDAGGPDALDYGCPASMVAMDGYCIDRYEAPNREGELPLVMYNFVESEAWCESRGNRLCFDDEWLTACEGSAGTPYPYGDSHEPGACNDDKVWKVYDQTALNGWPTSAAGTGIESVTELFAAASDAGAAGAAAAQHVESIYQAEPAGANTACHNEHEVYDLTGNVEEWTRRRDGGTSQFHGNLKGRYWAEARTCQSSVTTHGDGFRLYEIGFRCCRDRL